MTSRNRRRQRRLKWMGCDDNCHRLNGVLLCFNQTPPASMPAEARLESVSVPAEKSKSLYLLCISFCTTVFALKKMPRKLSILARTFSWGSSRKKKETVQKKMPRKNSFRTWGSGDAKACQCSCVGKNIQKKTPLLESISRPVLPMQSVMLKPSP